MQSKKQNQKQKQNQNQKTSRSKSRTKKKLLWYGKCLLLLYLIYVLGFGVLLYLLPMPPEHVPPASQFYGDRMGPDRALLVEKPKEAFGRRVEVIRSAQQTLDVCCHCVKTGETSDCFFGELIQAADRGVHVRVLLDGAVGGLTGTHGKIDLALRAHPNIEYRTYNPVKLWKPWGWNIRLHDKFILADDRMLLLGGRNIGDEYFDPPGYKGPVTYDRDVLVWNTASGQADETEQSVTAQVRAYMDTLWEARETAKDRPLSEWRQQEGKREQLRLRVLAQRWEEEKPAYYLPKTPAEELAVSTRKITLLSNPLGDFKREPVIGAALARLLSGCHDIRIQTPYATGNRHTLAALTAFARKGRVEYLTNSVTSSPNLPAFSNYISQRQKFLDTGIELYEYQSQDSIHGKSCVADGRLAVVGSFNLDDRSLYLDTETVLVIDSPGFYHMLDEGMDQLFDRSARVGPENRYLPSERVVAPSGVKQLLMSLVSLVSRPLQFLI